MSDTTTASPPPAPAARPTGDAPAPPPPPSPPPPRPPRRTRVWLAALAGSVAVALLAGATAVLFVRVQEARDRADEAVVLAGERDASQDALEARLAALDEALAGIQASGAETVDDVDGVRRQVRDLRRCVNAALDAFAAATQSGQPVAIEKC